MMSSCGITATNALASINAATARSLATGLKWASGRGKLGILAIILAITHIELLAQTQQLQHIHDGGWGLHPVTLTVKPDGLVISTQSAYQASNGLTSYCNLPTFISISNIIKASAQPYHGFLGVDGRVMELHLEIRDEHGKKSTLNFVSGTAIHDNENRWHEGQDGGIQVQEVALFLKEALVGQKSKSTNDAEATQHLHKSDTIRESGVPRDAKQEVQSSNPAHYDIQVVGPKGVYKATVWPTAEGDPSHLLIAMRDTSANKLISLEDISKIEVKQRVLEFVAADPSVIFQGRIGPEKRPKVLQLFIEIRGQGTKTTYAFVSDTVMCEKEAPCREGTDGGQVIKELADALHRSIDEWNAALRRAKEQDAQLRAAPSGLVTTVEYDDSRSFFHTKRISAGDKAVLVVNVENRGPGTAYRVLISATTNRSTVRVGNEEKLGDIAAGESRRAHLLIEAALDVADGDVTINVDVREEKRDFKARQLDITVPTAALKPPQLVIENYAEINDGNTGLAQGNGNKIPENGEKFELQAFVRNSGTEPAVGVVLAAAQTPVGLEPLVGSAELGTIQAGETKGAKLAFALARTWAGSSLQIQLKVTDGRGAQAGSAIGNFTVKAASSLPVLYAATRVLVNGTETRELTNGQNAELEITPENKGEIEAVDVVLRVIADNVLINADPISVGSIRPHEKHLSNRVAFSVPRSFPQDRLPVRIELSQKDFPATTVNAELVVRRRLPDLHVNLRVLESSGPQILTQNETSQVELELVNTGTLAAQEVVASIDIKSPGIVSLDPLQTKIGEIAPGGVASAKLRLHASRSAAPGKLAVRISVVQADFPAVAKTAELEVQAEKPNNVRVVSPPAEQVLPIHRTPPTVVFANLQNGDHFHDGLVQIVGVASSNRHITHLELTVSDRHLSDDAVRQSSHLTKTAEGGELWHITMPIPLDFGENKIQLTAYDEDNQRSESEIIVIRDRPTSMSDIEIQRLEVVEVRCQTPKGSGGASGFYVGKDEMYAYFATAFHVLQKQAGADDLVESAELRFYSHGVPVEAQVLNHHDLDDQLAVIYIPIKDLPSGLVPMSPKSANVGVPIHIIGNPAHQGWAVWRDGKVLNEDPESGKGRMFTSTANESLFEGFSGGPVLDDEGNLLGMHLNGNNKFATNLKSEEIFRLLKIWGVWRARQPASSPEHAEQDNHHD